jgi:signal transduction histidine kinase
MEIAGEVPRRHAAPRELRISTAAERAFITSRPAGAADRRLALATVAVSALIFVACIPFATVQLAQVWAFIPAYQSALVVCDLVTAALIFGQARIARSAALIALGAAYLFSACLAVVHALSFPGLLSPGGVLGGGAQTTAWLYMVWHAGFPLLVISYAVLKGAPPVQGDAGRIVALTVGGVLAATLLFALLATAGESTLPAVMRGNRYTPAMIFVVSTVWLLSLVALVLLWRRKPYTVLQLWLMVVMCAWLFDVGLAAVFNAGRFDLGFYAGRIYGLAAASFVLLVLLMENAALHARLARSLGRHGDRLRILAAIDQAIIAGQSGDAIAASVIQPLRELLDVPRAIVNRFEIASGQVEWVAAAGRRRTHIGPGVRYSIGLMGDPQALARGEPQLIDVHALPPGDETAALLASGVRWYMAVPMISGGELIGAISFGGDSADFSAEQMSIAQEVAAQLAIATAQTRLLEQAKAHAVELDAKVKERTAALQAANQELESFSYSVSHDLRAPLRAIDGYAQMLEEDYVQKLDAEAQRLLGVVRGNARRMGQLIDDLLAFSRLGRQQPVLIPVDMTSLAREAVEELRGARAVAVELGELPRATADPALIRQVWINLIGNAIKYSSKKPDARVVIAAREEAGRNVYSVRDNGAGFDMRYAEKLFGVFQRLHSIDEFEGTGVGLAIVQRIVARHGGQVRAEGKPGAGACFEFSLPRVAQ